MLCNLRRQHLYSRWRSCKIRASLTFSTSRSNYKSKIISRATNLVPSTWTTVDRRPKWQLPVPIVTSPTTPTVCAKTATSPNITWKERRKIKRRWRLLKNRKSSRKNQIFLRLTNWKKDLHPKGRRLIEAADPFQIYPIIAYRL